VAHTHQLFTTEIDSAATTSFTRCATKNQRTTANCKNTKQTAKFRFVTSHGTAGGTTCGCGEIAGGVRCVTGELPFVRVGMVLCREQVSECVCNACVGCRSDSDSRVRAFACIDRPRGFTKVRLSWWFEF
jgi:hypothetical protein